MATATPATAVAVSRVLGERDDGQAFNTRMAHAFGKLETVDGLIARLGEREKQRTIQDFNKVGDLGISWHEEGPSHKAGYYARIDGRDMRLTQGAMKTANRLIKGPQDLRHWSMYSDPNAFPKALRNVIDNDARKQEGIQLVRNATEVTAILPPDYQLRSARSMVSDLAKGLEEHVGDIKGVLAVEQGEGDYLSYRVVMGNNIMPSLEPAKGQYMMFCLSMSEHGQCDSSTMLGLFRTYCTNSAIRRQGLAKWNHRQNESKFLNKTGESIRNLSYMQSQFTAVFEEMYRSELPVDPDTLLKDLKDYRLISKEHYDAAKDFARLGYEGEPITKHYDLFNALTKAAQDLPSVTARQEAEETSLELFSAPGGIIAELHRASTRRARNAAIVAD